ncbi:MAG TPA: adenylate/guanylate cyclase domain-containing protein [Alphaproteobacteria bacterium]
MKDPGFERALSAEILASELIRVQVLAATLAVLFTLDVVLFGPFHDLLRTYATRPLPTWLPVAVIGPFLAYEGITILVLRYRIARGWPMPEALRLLNAAIETSLPTAILWAMTHYLSPAIAFGTWPELLYAVFIVASTLRLDFLLPLFTGAVGTVGYMTVAMLAVPLSTSTTDPIATPLYHLTKAGIILLGGIVAGLVAMRLRSKFRRAFEETTARERVTNVFGQHVSPAVVDRLLGRDAEFSGETREVCVVFLDIRNFTAGSRARRPTEVVDFLNAQFAFMIEAIDRHGGFINKFLGDGFLAVFGAPLDDPNATQHAVAACRDILAEIDRRGLGAAAWPLRVGIGIHAGAAVVGNVGSPRRKEFTVIGDTVNLASRLEQLTKDHGSRLLVSDTVARQLGQELGPATPLGDVTVRGYDTPLQVWRLD